MLALATQTSILLSDTWLIHPVALLHRLSDILIFGAALAIPFVLLSFLLRGSDGPLRTIIGVFIGFLLTLGIGHLFQSELFWLPDYPVNGVWKAVTAVMGWGAVLTLIRLAPSILAMPSRAAVDNQLRAINERLDCALEAGHIGVWQWHVEGNQFDADHRVRAMHRTPTEWTAEGLEAFIGRIHHDDRDKVRAAIRACVETEEKCSFDYRLVDEEGQFVQIQSHCKLQHNSIDATRQVVGVCIDVTQSRRHLEEIAKLSLIASKSRHSMIISRPDGVAEWANEAFERMTGYAASEVIGKAPGKLLQGPQTDPETVEQIRQKLERCESVSVEMINYSKAGKPYWISLEVDPVFDADGNVTYYIATQVDISERKRREVELQQAREAAEVASRSKSRFLANMSHEIRTPLNGILGFTDVLLQGDFDPRETRRYLETIKNSGQHLLTLINDVLDLSKVEAGHFECERSECSPLQIVREVLSLLRVKAQEKCITLECRCTTGIPATVKSDQARLRQLLMNLVGNAIKFTDYGGVTVIASLDRSGPQPMLVLEVHDTGIGIAEQSIKRIFEPFEQVDSSITRRYEGTGLGLAITKRIVEGLGGDIQVTSREKVGSTFTVRIPTGSLRGVPMESDWTSESLQDSSRRPSERDQPQLNGLRILLCEDGQVNRDLIRLVLANAGADVVATTNGREGVDRLLADHMAYDVILMDMQMPVLDGYSASREIRGLGWKGPLIALTAHAMRGDEEKARTAGCSGYLTKPVDIQELLSELSRYCPEEDSGSPLRSTLPNQDGAFDEIILRFYDSLDDRLVQLRRWQQAGEFERIAEEAHVLKGTGGTVGFVRFTTPAGRLEIAARQADPTAVAECIDELFALARRVDVDAIRRRLQSQPTTTAPLTSDTAAGG